MNKPRLLYSNDGINECPLRCFSPSFFALNKKDSSYFREVLSTLGMGLEDRMKTKIGLLSGGQRQAASLLMATIAEPELLLLDEHTAALDPGAAEKVMALTKKIVRKIKLLR